MTAPFDMRNIGTVMEESALYYVLMSALFFAVTHFSVLAMMYAFFFGCIFALVRIITDNLLYTITMHAIFNIINICFAYMNEISLLVLTKAAFLVLGGIAFLVTMVMLFYINDSAEAITDKKERYALWKACYSYEYEDNELDTIYEAIPIVKDMEGENVKIKK